jgi:predicted MFS family arabinose efflux permease
VAGALAPPLATRLVDRGLGRAITLIAMITAIAALGVSLLAARIGVFAVVAAAALLDAAASSNLVVGQRAIYGGPPDLRSRMTALFIATFFAVGAISSVAAAWCFARFGWTGVTVLAAVLPFAALLYALNEGPALDHISEGARVSS